MIYILNRTLGSKHQLWLVKMKFPLLFQLCSLVSVYRTIAGFPHPAVDRRSRGLFHQGTSQVHHKVVDINKADEKIHTRKPKTSYFVLHLCTVMSERNRNAFGTVPLERTFKRRFYIEGNLFCCHILIYKYA